MPCKTPIAIIRHSDNEAKSDTKKVIDTHLLRSINPHHSTPHHRRHLSVWCLSQSPWLNSLLSPRHIFPSLAGSRKPNAFFLLSQDNHLHVLISTGVWFLTRGNHTKIPFDTTTHHLDSDAFILFCPLFLFSNLAMACFDHLSTNKNFQVTLPRIPLSFWICLFLIPPRKKHISSPLSS